MTGPLPRLHRPPELDLCGEPSSVGQVHYGVGFGARGIAQVCDASVVGLGEYPQVSHHERLEQSVAFAQFPRVVCRGIEQSVGGCLDPADLGSKSVDATVHRSETLIHLGFQPIEPCCDAVVHRSDVSADRLRGAVAGSRVVGFGCLHVRGSYNARTYKRRIANVQVRASRPGSRCLPRPPHRPSGGNREAGETAETARDPPATLTEHHTSSRHQPLPTIWHEKQPGTLLRVRWAMAPER